MIRNFDKDRQAAREAEKIVFSQLSSLLEGYTVKDLTDKSEYYLKGDLVAVAANGDYIFIEVKDDKCIADTRNILVEKEVYYHSSGITQKYNSTADVYAVVSRSENKIYFLDHYKLKRFAEFAPSRTIPHEDQTTYCSFVSLGDAKYRGILLGELTYKEEEIEWKF